VTRRRVKALSEKQGEMLRYARQFQMLGDAIAKMELVASQARATQYRRFGAMMAMACVDMATGHSEDAEGKLKAAHRALIAIRNSIEPPRQKRGKSARDARE
jgi:hypothetical protein